MLNLITPTKKHSDGSISNLLLGDYRVINKKDNLACGRGTLAELPGCCAVHVLNELWFETQQVFNLVIEKILPEVRQLVISHNSYAGYHYIQWAKELGFKQIEKIISNHQYTTDKTIYVYMMMKAGTKPMPTYPYLPENAPQPNWLELPEYINL